METNSFTRTRSEESRGAYEEQDRREGKISKTKSIKIMAAVWREVQ